MLDVSEITTTAPAFYAILPFTPIIGVLIFDGKWGPQLHIITILVICMLIASILGSSAALIPRKFSLVWKWLIAGWQMRLLTW